MLVFYFLLLVVEVSLAENYVATSTHEMAQVLQIENELLDDLRLHVAALERRVRAVRVILDDALQRQQQQSRLDPAAYIANPLNSLPLVRRMHSDAAKVFAFLNQEPSEDLQQISDFRLDVISAMDLEEAAKGLLRIQQVYNLEAGDMARGLLSHKQFNAKLSSLDCLALASHLRAEGNSRHAVEWLKVALELYEETPERVYALVQIDRVHILSELNQIHFASENWLAVKEVSERILEHATRVQDMQRARAYLKGLQRHLMHLRVCRGHSRPLVSSSLRCRYNSENAPFLRLAPLKLEQLSIDPHVVLYRDVIHSHERDHILELAKPYLRRALVGTGQLDPKRFAMHAAFNYNESVHGQRLRQRIQDMSGLELTNSGNLAVLNYGIAGRYYMHMDCWFSQDEAVYKTRIRNNRIATVLFYLTDVQLGGVTSFPALELGVQPSRGSALIWHNMNNDGDCDERTLHAACPVLLGTRWVATQWINEQWPRKSCLAKS